MLNSLQKIKASSVLDDEDLASLQDLMPGLEKSIQSHTIYRTTTEALFSVLNDVKFPTAASKYHQAKREQLVMFENLVSLSFDYRTALIELDEVESKIANCKGFKLKKLEVRRDRLQFKLMWMRKDGQERIRELKMWAQIMQNLAKSDVFDLDNKDTDELKSFTIRYLLELPAACRAGNDVGGAVNIIAQARTGLVECERRNIKLPSHLVERSKRLLKGA
ncbi:MAG: hypothetical protein PHY05_00530 [Methanothrix sp.]|jgi:hypothetical protein|nr:hypothetical protein [Methanothrix sp.]